MENAAARQGHRKQRDISICECYGPETQAHEKTEL